MHHWSVDQRDQTESWLLGSQKPTLYPKYFLHSTIWDEFHWWKLCWTNIIVSFTDPQQELGVCVPYWGSENKTRPKWPSWFSRLQVAKLIFVVGKTSKLLGVMYTNQAEVVACYGFLIHTGELTCKIYQTMLCFRIRYVWHIKRPLE